MDIKKYKFLFRHRKGYCNRFAYEMTIVCHRFPKPYPCFRSALGAFHVLVYVSYSFPHCAIVVIHACSLTFCSCLVTFKMLLYSSYGNLSDCTYLRSAKISQFSTCLSFILICLAVATLGLISCLCCIFNFIQVEIGTLKSPLKIQSQLGLQTIPIY